MTQTICRMYGTNEAAAQAAGELKSNGYDDVHHVAGGMSADKAMAALLGAYVLKAHAKVYAEGVAKGGSLVTVHAPFGTAARAMRIVDSYKPVASGVAEEVFYQRSWDAATPVSSVLQMPVLSDHRSSFSAFWGLPMLAASSCSMSSSFGLPLLSDTRGSRSSSMGLPLLSKNPAPLSSMLGLKVLSGRR